MTDPQPEAPPDPREPYGRIFHERGRLPVNSERRVPFSLAEWPDRSEEQKEIDMRGAEAVAAAERERVTARLRVHYLAGITCDHGRHEDNPVCACSEVFLGWHPGTGEAVEAWIGHVMGGDSQERSEEKAP